MHLSSSGTSSGTQKVLCQHMTTFSPTKKLNNLSPGIISSNGNTVTPSFFVPSSNRVVSLRPESKDLPPVMSDEIGQKYIKKSSVIRIDARNCSESDSCSVMIKRKPSFRQAPLTSATNEPLRSREAHRSLSPEIAQSQPVTASCYDTTLPYAQKNVHQITTTTSNILALGVPSNNTSRSSRVTFVQDRKSPESNSSKFSPVKTKPNQAIKSPPEFRDTAEQDKCLFYTNRRFLWCIILFVMTLLFVLLCVFVYYVMQNNNTSNAVQVSPSPLDPQYNITTKAFPRITQVPKKVRQVCLKPGCVKAAAYIQSNMDPLVNPCQDFYRYACGGWMNENYISPIDNNYGVVSVLTEKNDRILNELFRRRAEYIGRDFFQNYPIISEAERKASNFYLSCIDLMEIEALGPQPLLDLISALGGWNVLNGSSKFNLNEQLYQNHGILSNNVLFSINIKISPFDNKTNYIFMIDQLGSLTLPDPSLYWFNVDPTHSPDIEQAMKRTIKIILKLLNANDIDNVVDNIYDFEKNLSKIHIASQNQQYLEKLSLGEMRKLCPEINWVQLFHRISAGILINAKTEVVVKLGMQEYLKNLSNLIQRTDEKTLENYFMWRVAFTRSFQLSSKFRQARFYLLYDIKGIVGSPDRWRDCLRFTKLQFNEAVQVMFSREKFDWKNKLKIKELAESIKVELNRDLETLNWMETSTRESAQKKLADLKFKIGFDKKYLDDPKLLNQLYKFPVKKRTFFENYENSIKHKVKTTAQQLLRPVNTKQPFPSFQADNSVYYSRTSNEIVLGIGYLQPPYYNPTMSSAVNYGAIGSTVGHELIHAFEFHGDKFDITWGKDVTNYQALVSCVAEKYNRFGIRGITAYENVADMAGVKLAYQAYKKQQEQNIDDSQSILQGISNDRVFFLSFAQTFCVKQTSAAYVEKINYGLHAPERHRVIGSLSQFPEFAKVFNCPLGSEMNPKQKCKVW